MYMKKGGLILVPGIQSCFYIWYKELKHVIKIIHVFLKNMKINLSFWSPASHGLTLTSEEP